MNKEKTAKKNKSKIESILEISFLTLFAILIITIFLSFQGIIKFIDPAILLFIMLVILVVIVFIIGIFFPNNKSTFRIAKIIAIISFTITIIAIFISIIRGY